MSKLDPRIEAIRIQYGLEPTDFWELPQKKGTWVAKHSALEVAAAKAGIAFDNPTIIEANSEAGIAVLSVAGSMYQRISDKENRELRREWATGEASPKNNKNAYPWAMAEKRAKDRVILKLIGIHGLVYSEDEMSGSGVERPDRQVAEEVVDEDGVIQSNPTSKQHFKTVYDDITACKTLKQLQGAWERHQPVIKVLSEEHRRMLEERKNEMKDYLSEDKASGGKPLTTYNFDSLEPAH